MFPRSHSQEVVEMQCKMQVRLISHSSQVFLQPLTVRATLYPSKIYSLLTKKSFVLTLERNEEQGRSIPLVKGFMGLERVNQDTLI